MSRKAIHISITTPCHESWDALDAIERGAFCHSCQKEVIDFSTMTDREVIEYLEKHKVGCGRFRKDQLDLKLSIPKLDNGLFRWKALLLGLLPILAFKPVRASLKNHIKVETYASIYSDEKDTSTRLLNKDTININGKVLDEKGEGLIYARLCFIDSSGKIIKKGTTTDIDGNFSLQTSVGELANTNHKIRVSYIGFESQTISITNKPNQNYTITLKEGARILMGEVVIVNTRHKVARMIKHWFLHAFRIKHH
jgi:hypothetical protein